MFFDGVPDPAEVRAAKLQELLDAELLAEASSVPMPVEEVSGASVGVLTRVVADPDLEGTPPPFEAYETWKQVLQALPLDSGGGVDWVAALRDELIAPHDRPGAESPRMAPFTLATLGRVPTGDARTAVLDFDVDMKADESFFDVRFPHSSHTQLLACNSCHPDFVNRDIKMEQILGGEYCGVCHGRVSFEPETSCARCHPKLAFPDNDTVIEQETRARQAPLPLNPGLMARGESLYGRVCSMCHGEDGDGKGRIAPELDPKPRDFTAGKYKFRTTLSTQLPSDSDIFRTITRGVPGTSMPAWNELSYEDRWALTHYVKSFSSKFDGAAPVDPIPMPESPPITDALMQTGEEYFKGAGCNSCHGDTGGGDGPSAPSLKDDWGFPLRPFNFKSGRPIKGGSEPEDIYRTVMTGLTGTPMPGFGEFLPPADAWAITQYVLTFIGVDPEPFAVKGDMAFERGELSMAQMGSALEELADAPEFDAATQLLMQGDYPPVVFPHWRHRVRFKCSACHPDLFEMKKGSNPITMDALRQGEFCAKCHNGETAFEVTFDSCTRCHVQP